MSALLRTIRLLRAYVEQTRILLESGGTRSKECHFKTYKMNEFFQRPMQKTVPHSSDHGHVPFGVHNIPTSVLCHADLSMMHCVVPKATRIRNSLPYQGGHLKVENMDGSFPQPRNTQLRAPSNVEQRRYRPICQLCHTGHRTPSRKECT